VPVWFFAQLLRLYHSAFDVDLVDDLESWAPAERRQLAQLLWAKGAPSATRHQQLLRTHRRLLEGVGASA